MDTQILLSISCNSTEEIVEEVYNLTKSNTPDNESIKVKQDEIDKKLLIIRFDSFRGRQVDLVDDIMRSYSHFLDCYSDISVLFASRRKPIKSFGYNVDRESVIAFLNRFFELLDSQNKEELLSMLFKQISVKDQKKSNKFKTLESATFIEEKCGKENLFKSEHIINNYRFSRDYSIIKCDCECRVNYYQEKKKELSTDGNYLFSIASINEKLYIKEIDYTL